MEEELTLKVGDKIVCGYCNNQQIRDSHSIRKITGFYFDVNKGIPKIVLECGHETPVWTE